MRHDEDRADALSSPRSAAGSHDRSSARGAGPQAFKALAASAEAARRDSGGERASVAGSPIPFTARARRPQVPPRVVVFPASELAGRSFGAVDSVAQNNARLVEYSHIQLQCPPGVYVAPSPESPEKEWHGVIFLREGWYQGASFRFLINFPERYPAEPPTFRFLSQVVHPLVNLETGEVDIRWWFPEWNIEDCNALLLLHFVRSMFYERACFIAAPDQQQQGTSSRSLASSSVETNENGRGGLTVANPGIQKLLKSNPTEFLKEISDCILESRKAFGSPCNVHKGDNLGDDATVSGGGVGAVGGASVGSVSANAAEGRADSSRRSEEGEVQPGLTDCFEGDSLFNFRTGFKRSPSFSRKRKYALTFAINEFVARAVQSGTSETREDVVFREWLESVYIPTYVAGEGEVETGANFACGTESGEEWFDGRVE